MIEDKDRAPVTLVTVTLTADDADALDVHRDLL